MDGRTDGRKISPFYKTSSPIGAAAQKAIIYPRCMALKSVMVFKSYGPYWGCAINYGESTPSSKLGSSSSPNEQDNLGDAASFEDLT